MKEHISGKNDFVIMNERCLGESLPSLFAVIT